MPMGSGALAGTTVGVDRWELARELGFETPSSNSLDAVSDRDFVAEFLFVATLIGVHLSRLAEALILYSTAEFAFLAISDRYATGSSMMPQKKNPDLLELIRAKSAVLLGKLAGWLATVRTLPSAYDKDLQQDKPAVFEATDDLILMLPVMTGVLRSLTINPGRMREAIPPEAMATDLADYLVARGVPFREARELVAQAVSVAEKLGCRLDRLPLEQWQTINPTFDKDLFGVFDVEASIARRTVWGGTALDAVQEQMELAERALEENEG
jgi:argininosuccinate lyase